MRNAIQQAVAWCEQHEKLSYTTRKRARHVAKEHTTHKNAYRCEFNENLWHIGSLPDVVRHGHMTREEVFGREPVA